MPSMPARPITLARITTSARAATALPPIVRMAEMTLLLGLPASPERRCRRYRWAGCTASETDCFLLACGNLGGRRKTPAFSFHKQNRIEVFQFTPRIAARPRDRRAASPSGVHLQGRRYGLCRRQALQLGGMEENPRQSRSAEAIATG